MEGLEEIKDKIECVLRIDGVLFKTIIEGYEERNRVYCNLLEDVGRRSECN